MIEKSLRSWILVDDHSDFPLQNIPFGAAVFPDGSKHVVTRIGDSVINLTELYRHGFFRGIRGLTQEVLLQPDLNAFIGLGKEVTGPVRLYLASLFEENHAALRDHAQARKESILPVDTVTMLMPLKVGNYTDFYSSIEHATNLGKMFRDPVNALLPNWRHLPVGYHGRASSIVVSGTPVHRPVGQVKPDDSPNPVCIPTRVLDYELEMAFVTCKPTKLGERISTETAEDHIFGFILFNDLSARDIQKWEYVPLGPFLSKDFASVVSPWVVTLEALEPFRTQGPVQEPEVLPYLQFSGERNFDLILEVAVRPPEGPETRVCQTNFRHMYWNHCQQLAHQTINGCNIQVGDLYASGTISGPDSGSYGSLLEMTWSGTVPFRLNGGGERTFLLDGDTVIIRGHGRKDGLRIGFGECVTTILPAL